MIAVSSIF